MMNMHRAQKTQCITCIATHGVAYSRQYIAAKGQWLMANGYLVDATLVATALKVGLEERTNDIQRHDAGDEVSRQSQYVGVVVLAGQFSQLGKFNHF